MRAIIYNHDMIAKITGNPDEGIEVGDKPKRVGLERLRFDGEQLIDIAERSEFYVCRKDGSWELHAVEVPGAQLIQMSHKQKWRIVNDNGTFRLKTDDELLQEAKERKILEVGNEREKRYVLMPYTTPDGADIRVKIGEEASKPRQTWLIGASLRGLAANIKGQKFTDDLIAADNFRHNMDNKGWIDFDEKMHQWIRAHIDAANYHEQDINNLATIEDIENYDVTNGYWP